MSGFLLAHARASGDPNGSGLLAFGGHAFETFERAGFGVELLDEQLFVVPIKRANGNEVFLLHADQDL